MDYRNYYELLGVPERAKTEEIKKAYHEKMKEWHPDRNPHRLEEANEMSRVLNEAWSILQDAGKRKEYDRMLKITRRKHFENISETDFFRKLKKASPHIARVVEDVTLLYRMFADGIRGKYPVNIFTLGTIAGGLLYFFLPLDIVPDFIIALGYTDDLAVLGLIIGALGGELKSYRKWLSGKKEEGK